MTPESFPKLRQEQREKHKRLFQCRIRSQERGGKGKGAGIIAVTLGTHMNEWHHSVRLLGILLYIELWKKIFFKNTFFRKSLSSSV